MDESLPSVVYQAVGMVSVQLEATTDEALARLKARAVKDERPLAELAKDVIERRARFDD